MRPWLLALLTLALALWLPGCPTGDDDDTAGDDDSGDDDSSEADDDSGDSAIVGFLGDATAGQDGYDGWEELYVIAEMGNGDDLCRVHYEVTSTAPREDCAVCTWAHDVVFADPQILVDEGGGCAAIDMDAASIAAIHGASRTLGYAEEYLGHADAIMIEQGGSWAAVDFATWDHDSGHFQYDWEASVVPD